MPAPITVQHTPWGTWEVITPSVRTEWPTWDRAIDEAKWHANQIQASLRTAPMWQLRRRLQAMQAQGFDTVWIARHLDATPAQVAQWCTDPAVHIISPTISRRIKNLFDWLEEHTGGRLRDTGPTPEATAHNWFPPAAWDDIDNPDENPAVTEGTLQDLLKALVDRMGSQKQVADAVGISTGHLYNLLTGRYHESKKWEPVFRDLWESLATQAAA